jgi:hypothetical protein
LVLSRKPLGKQSANRKNLTNEVESPKVIGVGMGEKHVVQTAGSFLLQIAGNQALAHEVADLAGKVKESACVDGSIRTVGITEMKALSPVHVHHGDA